MNTEGKLRKVYIGLDMGGTRIKMALVQEDGKVLKERSFGAESELSLEDRLDALVDDINMLLGEQYSLKGIGIAFPGIVDFKEGRILSEYVKYPDAHKVNLRDWAKRHWQVPLVVENDARAALVGEWCYGAGEGVDNVLMVTLGTGMGSAILIEGKLLRGSNFLAGNLGGHMTINFQGDTCNCGNVGCVETSGSTWALEGNFRKIPDHESSSLSALRMSYKNVFLEAAKGDVIAQQLKHQSLESWAAGIINLLHAYDPELVIVGGGIMESKDEILPFLDARIKERSWLPASGVPIMAAEQKNLAGILGVCQLLMRNGQT